MKSFWMMIAAFVVAAAGLLTYTKVQERNAASAREIAVAAQREADASAKAKAREAAGETNANVPAPVLTKDPAKPAEPIANSGVTPKAPSDPAEAPKVATPSIPADDAFPSAKVADKLTPVVVVARSYKPDGSPLAQTMGFLIAADMAVVGREVLTDSASVKLGLATGEVVETIGFVADDATRGFAIIKLAAPVKTNLAAKLAIKAVTEGEVVAVVGPLTPEGLRVAPIFARADVDIKFGAIVALSAPVMETPSGCAVVNAHGEIVGIVTGESTPVPQAQRAIAAASIGGTPRFAARPFVKTSAAAIAKGPVEDKAATESEAKLEPKPDGTTLVDGKYTIKGDGTATKPYEVSWEMLISAKDTYDPRNGMKKIPGRIAMLDGKHVRINGYVAFPLYVEQPKELLSMLNQWDGCCIGTPPTPYDAIEVRLGSTIAKDDKLATFGAVEGTFGVKPYLVGDWLVGLFTMDDAKLTTKAFGGFGS